MEGMSSLTKSNFTAVSLPVKLFIKVGKIFDISVMLLANKLKIKPFRFPVEFKLRLSGRGSNESLNQKLNYSFKTLKFLFNQSFFFKKKSIF